MPPRVRDASAQSPCIVFRSFLPASSLGSAAKSSSPKASISHAASLMFPSFPVMLAPFGLLCFRQGDADHFLVVAGKDTTAGESGMGPDHVSAAGRLGPLQDV